MNIVVDVAEPIKQGYTGNNGLYVKCDPDSAGCDLIEELASRLGVAVEKDKLHCTVMYSKKPVVPYMLPLFDDSFTVAGFEVKHWVGHNDKRYLVLGLQSEHLVRFHSAYVRSGAESTFIPYAPHITLAKDIAISDEFEELIKTVNQQLAAFPLMLRMSMSMPEDLQS